MMGNFKMPSHPIYSGRWKEHAWFIDDMAEALKGGTIEGMVEGMHRDLVEHKHIPISQIYADLPIRSHVARNGHILIKIDGKQWDEGFSQKTISSLRVRDILLPYDAFAIDISTSEWRAGWEYVLVGKHDNHIFIQFDNEGDEVESYTVVLQKGTGEDASNDKMIGEVISKGEVDEKDENIIYKILSIIMYCSLFKREPNKVDVRKVKARKTPKGNKYRISEVRLIQPEYALHGVAKGSERNKSERDRQTHIVRGHWRSQPYGKRDDGKTKPTWIAPFWKGSAKEAITKVVKI